MQGSDFYTTVHSGGSGPYTVPTKCKQHSALKGAIMDLNVVLTDLENMNTVKTIDCVMALAEVAVLLHTCLIKSFWKILVWNIMLVCVYEGVMSFMLQILINAPSLCPHISVLSEKNNIAETDKCLTQPALL